MIKRMFSNLKKNPIKITNNAWDKMNNIIKDKKNPGFLFSATSGGCNGFNYNLTLLDYNYYQSEISKKIKPNIIEYNKTILMIEPKSEILLFGTTIDYIFENHEKGIFESKFVYIPDKNLASLCGCGVSFNPKS